MKYMLLGLRVEILDQGSAFLRLAGIATTA